jgi:spermidine synthase
MNPPPARNRFAPVALLALASGLAALGHQTVWFRLTVDVLGANANTFARVAGAFFLGLAIGAWLASRKQAPAGRCWRWVAGAEFGVALLVLPVLVIGRHAEWLHGYPQFAGLIQWLLPLLLVLPPALMMGLVLPWLLHALQSAGELSPRRAVVLYAVNTLGGVAGIPLVLLGLLPAFGLTATALGLAGINGLIGLVMLLFARGEVPSPVQPPAAESPPAPTRLEWRLATLAFGSGLLVLALEVMGQLQLRQVSINSLFSSGGVLAVVLLALGTAPLLLPWVLRWTGGAGTALRCACLAGAAAGALQPSLKMLAGGINILPYELTAVPYTLALLGVALPTIFLPMLGAGLVFPLLVHHVTQQSGNTAPRLIGRLLMWNGLGGWLGAELANRALAPAFGLWGALPVLATGYFLMFRVAGASGEPCLPRANRWSVATLLVVALIAASYGAARHFPSIGLGRDTRLLALEVGREGVVAVVESARGGRRIVLNNTYTLGGSRAKLNQERQAHLPLLLHGDARSIATLGVATGSTVGGVILHPNVEGVDAIELSPLVVKFARQHFGEFNRDVFNDPRVRVITDDARWVVAQQPAAYDVVIGDLFMPWETGAGRLFTREHFVNVRRSLTAGGLYCQWLPMFQLTRAQYESVLRTFLEVFPETVVVRGDFYAMQPIIGLVGGRTLNALDWAAVSAACARLRTNAEVDDPLVRQVEGVAMMLVGEPVMPAHAPLNTLANGWLEFDAGRNILGLQAPWFVGGPYATHLRELHDAAAPRLPESLRAAHDSGQFFLTLESAAHLNSPELPALQAQVLERLPTELREDSTADWRQWPGRVKPDPTGKTAY